MSGLAARWDLGYGSGTSFDRFVLGSMFALAVAVALILLRGDQVGVQLTDSGPVGEAHRGSVVTLRFNEDMNRESVAARFGLEPPVAGDVQWSGRTMIFRPAAGLQPGQEHFVVLAAGAESESGRKVLGEHRFQFNVAGARVAYLAPIDGSVKNLWIVGAESSPSAARQLTHAVTGVAAFDVSPDGGRIVYAERNAAQGADLKVLEVDAGEARVLANCGEVLCTNPVWSPDGTKVAFERQSATPSAIPGFLRDSTRVWVVEAMGSPPKASPLLDDLQLPAHTTPRWAPDGSWLALSVPLGTSTSGPGVFFHHLSSKTTKFRPAAGPAGAFSGDSARFVLPAFAPRSGQMKTLIQVVSPDTLEATPASETALSPGQLAWGPGPDDLTFDDRSIGGEGTLGRQIHAMDTRDGSTKPFLADASYDHSFFSWDRSGRLLLIERTLVRSVDPKADTRSQVWIFDAASGALTRLAVNAFQPRWVP